MYCVFFLSLWGHSVFVGRREERGAPIVVTLLLILQILRPSVAASPPTLRLGDFVEDSGSC